MIGASLYIIGCTARNRLRVRLRRLREPRYLVGAIVGVAYLYFTLFARAFRAPSARRRGRGVPSGVSLDSGSLAAMATPIAGAALLVVMAIAWLFPGDSGMLDFTEAETEFLFPAPVSRRQLIVHRLTRSQLGLLFAAIVPAIFFPAATGPGRLKMALSMWLVFLTMRVHFTGITLARASLRLPGADGRRRQWMAPVLVLAALAIVGGAVARALSATPLGGIRDAVARIDTAVGGGLPHLILWPFAALVGPLFSPWPGPFLTAVVWALVVLAANVVWVLRSDAALQEATVQSEARRAARKARAHPVVRARATAWTLPLTGRTETVFLWKNAMQILRGTTGVTALRYVVAGVGVSVGVASGVISATQAAGVAAAFGMLSLAVAGFAIVFGPQIVRNDLREDLLHLAVLKTWPVPAPALVRGEMFAPAVMLTLLAWIAIACALPLSAAAFSSATLGLRVASAVAAALLAPAMIAAQLTVHNAAALLFPAWVPLGNQRPRGLDAMGQRLILFFGIFLVLAVVLLPGAIPAGLVWLAFHRLFGSVVYVVAAGVLAAIVLLEVLIATEALGPAYEVLDLTAVERAE